MTNALLMLAIVTVGGGLFVRWVWRETEPGGAIERVVRRVANWLTGYEEQ
jgi:hypothetical protein